MAWTLSPHISFCAAADEVLLLDVARDRYFRLAAPNAAIFLSWVDAEPEAALPSQLEPLARAGLLQAGARREALRPVRHKLPTQAVTAATGWNRGGGHVLDTLASYRAAWWALRQGLLPALERITPPSRATMSSEDLAARFLWLRARLPRRPRCLLDSLALIDFLHGQNAASTLVFGVHARPFTAHCWVEHRGMVLNDGVDAVASFTPILVR